jgi:hypothetical protein
MKTLLRSMFIADPRDDAGRFLQNFTEFCESGLSFDIPEDGVIFKFIKDFVQTHRHVPDVTSLRDYYVLAMEDSIVQRISTLSGLQAFSQGDFRLRLENRAKEQRSRKVADLLKDAATIHTTGIKIKRGREEVLLQGPIEAIHYILDKSHDLVAPVIGQQLSGEITRDGDNFKSEYDQHKANPEGGFGQWSGIHQMDIAFNGAKKFELWIHAAFTGGMKSTLMKNWAYNQAVHFGSSSLIFSLEEPYIKVRRDIYALHSAHAKFKDIRHKLGLQKDPTATIGLPRTHIRDGTLEQWHPKAEEFLNEYVIPDLNGNRVVGGIDPNTGSEWMNPSHYGKIHVEVADPDKSDFTVADLRHRAELIYSKDPFRLLFVDHAGLMAPRKWVQSTTDRLNEVIRDLKRLAMNFNRGQGIPVVALFQINREGHKAALKTKEKSGQAKYELEHLSYANEAERSGDIITAGWTDDDLEKINRYLIMCLKSRDQKKFEAFMARVEGPCMRLLSIPVTEQHPTQSNENVGNTIDGLADSLGK